MDESFVPAGAEAGAPGAERQGEIQVGARFAIHLLRGDIAELGGGEQVGVGGGVVGDIRVVEGAPTGPDGRFGGEYSNPGSSSGTERSGGLGSRQPGRVITPPVGAPPRR
ncbi:hypothetical protein [Nocardia cyriacigeorgica]|uniref:hypothetical protein n=1 Tax=Nocardia cyriacigeorgica TaxID=135487 RepID=UPI00189336F8|nr:hypothetical protein [Nocardia cyriacigeorgica]MBF6087798.1 hypothetical protein [Nocardia cyriacigeorgica]